MKTDFEKLYEDMVEMPYFTPIKAVLCDISSTKEKTGLNASWYILEYYDRKDGQIVINPKIKVNKSSAGFAVEFVGGKTSARRIHTRTSKGFYKHKTAQGKWIQISEKLRTKAGWLEWVNSQDPSTKNLSVKEIDDLFNEYQHELWLLGLKWDCGLEESEEYKIGLVRLFWRWRDGVDKSNFPNIKFINYFPSKLDPKDNLAGWKDGDLSQFEERIKNKYISEDIAALIHLEYIKSDDKKEEFPPFEDPI